MDMYIPYVYPMYIPTDLGIKTISSCAGTSSCEGEGLGLVHEIMG